MSKTVSKKKKRLLICLLSVFFVLLAAVSAFLIYVNDYYKADLDAIEAFKTDAAVVPQVLDNGNIVYKPDGAETGLIFYPGGKVEYTAYKPLMEVCASKGIMCVLVKMPFNLAIFDTDAADGVRAQFPEIKHWYIGGHSLGGAAGAMNASKHPDEYDGLILLASYSSKDISKTSLKVLSVYGSQDKVLKAEDYNKYKSNLPDSFREVVIEGGCHSYFGMYGAQKGDGTPTVSNGEQINKTAEEITKFINQ